MALTTGTRLGPYQIVALLGAGGMGEVYRARDERLSRDVAVKVLPEGFGTDPDRVRRFEQEARAAGQINHPNIMAVYDVGSHEGTLYIVSEYIEGETLRELLEHGPLPVPKAIRIAVEIAQGLAAAHAKGIVHRDLKPENLILLRDGRVKILDFGIAKLTRDGMGKVHDTGPTLTNLTVSGQLLGTASYMAPEQIRDHGVDHRTDLFTLGAILYEMITGFPAFAGETVADRMSAILRGEPGPLPREVASDYPGLAKVLRRALEKSPDLRIDSARDFALALELVHEAAGRAGPSGADAAVVASDFQLLTFRDGEITAARFAPDGQTVAYSAAWDGKPTEIYVARVEMPESHAIGIQGDLLSVAPTSELAVLLDGVDAGGFIVLGTVGRVSMLGGVPRRVIDAVTFADWGPDGRSLAVIREQGGAFQLEYPVGRVIHRSTGWLSHVRVARDGKKLAVLEHPLLSDNGGHLLEIDLEGRIQKHPTHWSTAWGLALSSRGTPVVSGQILGSSPGVYETQADGGLRVVQRLTGFNHVEDVSAGGDLLFTQVKPQMKMEWHEPGEDPRDLTWLDWTLARDISPDGKWVLFDETGLANRGASVSYMRGTDGSPPVRLGEGLSLEFSPDLRWALIDNREGGGLMLVPTGAGHERKLDLPGLGVKNATWSPDGRAIVLAATEPGHAIRLYRYDLESGGVRVISEEGVGAHMSRVSPNGRFVVVKVADGSHALHPLDGGAPRPLEGVQPGERPHDWASDGSAIFAFERGKIPARIFRIDVASGKRELWHAITPRNPSGVSGFNSILLAMEGRACVGSYMRINSELYISRGAL